MSKTIEIVSVERELLVIAKSCVMQNHDLLVGQMKITDHKEECRAEIARLKDTYEKLKAALLAAPVVERQEPAGYVCADHLGNFEIINLKLTSGMASDHMIYDKPLYAEQPAPVAVVLPERRDLSKKIFEEMSPSERDISFKDIGWNACLDKVKELNQ